MIGMCFFLNVLVDITNNVRYSTFMIVFDRKMYLVGSLRKKVIFTQDQFSTN